MGATPIDNNDADGKSGKLYGWLLIIRCTRDEQHKRGCRLIDSHEQGGL